MQATIVIRDRCSLRAWYPTKRSGRHMQIPLTDCYEAAVRLTPDEIEDEVQYWREIMGNEPDAEVAVIE